MDTLPLIAPLIGALKANHPSANAAEIERAFLIAQSAHTGQMRKSGEEYITHPVAVTMILAELGLDETTLIASLLHDTVEDTPYSLSHLRTDFGDEIANLVDGVTKLDKLSYGPTAEAETVRKMVIAMSRDIRVLVIKLADRLHNARTWRYVSSESATRKARETLDIYAPLAHRLGMNAIKWELEDLSFAILEPKKFEEISRLVAERSPSRDALTADVIASVEGDLQKDSINATVTGRKKHFFSVYQKMVVRGREFNDIYDLVGIRVLVNDVRDCYAVLGSIHARWSPVPGRFKDYIAIPKANNYQSLHTTVIGPKAERIEIQIRTSDMDQIAETGIAAHWKYKEVGSNTTPKLQWVEELLEFNKNVDSSREFLDAVKNDLDLGGVFIFTPKGDVHELSHGSTPLDFAYTVHTEVGNHCVGAKVNGKIVPLRYQLRSGDTLEILTSKTQSPSKDWLNIARTSRARTKIKQYLLKVERDHYREVGKDIFEKALRVYGISTNRFKKTNDLEKILAHFHYKVEDEIYIHLGAGKIQAKNIFEVLPDFKPEEETEDQKALDEIKATGNKIIEQAKKRKNRDQQIIVDGLDDIMVRLARCCTPIPGDPIEGHITRGRGITVHVKNCPRVHDSSTGGTRHVDVEWNNFLQHKHSVVVKVITHDRPGILSHISKTINNLGINIRSAMARSLPDRRGSFLFEVELKDLTELTKMILTIEALEEVISASRTTS